MELKFAPLAGARFIKFEDISEVKRISDKKIFIYYSEDSKEKKVRIPVQILEESDLKEFLETVEEKISA